MINVLNKKQFKNQLRKDLKACLDFSNKTANPCHAISDLVFLLKNIVAIFFIVSVDLNILTSSKNSIDENSWGLHAYSNTNWGQRNS